MTAPSIYQESKIKDEGMRQLIAYIWILMNFLGITLVFKAPLNINGEAWNKAPWISFALFGVKTCQHVELISAP